MGNSLPIGTGTKVFITAADTLLIALLILTSYRYIFYSKFLASFWRASDFLKLQTDRLPTLSPEFTWLGEGGDPELKPGFEGLYDGFLVRLPPTHIRISSQGLRDREFSIEKPLSTLRVAVLGDSFTFGAGVEAKETFPKVLERLLEKENTGFRVEVLNFGVPAYNTALEVKLLSRKALKFAPDIVVLAYLDDDCLDYYRENKLALGILAERHPLLPERGVYRNVAYSEALIQAIAAMKKEILQKPFEEAWRFVEQPLAELDALTKSRGIDVIIAVLGVLVQSHLEGLRSSCQKYGWQMVEVFKVFASLPEQERQKTILDPLDEHPSAEGHRLIAETLLPSVRQALKMKAGVKSR